MSNIVPKGHGDMVASDVWGNLDSSDFAIPHVKIGQPMSRKGTAGKFNYSNGAEFDKLERVKLLVPMKTRVLYGKGMDAGSRCSSDNFYVPSTRIQQPISPNCLTCFAAAWGEDDERKMALARDLEKKGNLRPPLCKETYNPLMVDKDMKPFFAQFQGTNLKEVSEKLLSRLRYEYAHVPPYLVAFDMTLGLAKGDFKVYNVAFSNFTVVDGEEAERMKNLWAAYSQTAAAQLANAHAEMDAEKNQDDVPF